jgi:hypothetical protein
MRIVSQTFSYKEREFKEEIYFCHAARLRSLIVLQAIARRISCLLFDVGRLSNCFNTSRRCLMNSLHSLVDQGLGFSYSSIMT